MQKSERKDKAKKALLSLFKEANSINADIAVETPLLKNSSRFNRMVEAVEIKPLKNPRLLV